MILGRYHKSHLPGLRLQLFHNCEAALFAQDKVWQQEGGTSPPPPSNFTMLVLIFCPPLYFFALLSNSKQQEEINHAF